MRIHLIAVGIRSPGWVQQGFDEYARRLKGPLTLQLHEIAPGTRGGSTNPERAMAQEAARIEAAVPRGALRIALDVKGSMWSTRELGDQLASWREEARDVAMLIGGPDGLTKESIARCDRRWSLSALTFPHALVRPIVAEQLYRAWSILNNHPYHRA